MKSLYSCSALSLAYPYFCCNIPRSLSLFPSTTVRSSSVSLPHFSFTPPFISFHFPFRTSSFIFDLLSSCCSLKQGRPAKIHLPTRIPERESRIPKARNKDIASPPQCLMSSLAVIFHNNPVRQPSVSASVRNASRRLSDSRI